MKVKNFIEHLTKNYEPDQEIAYSLWTIDDVAGWIAERRPEVDFADEQMVNVLDQMMRYCDAELGMNWTLLDCCIDNIAIESEVTE